MSAEAREAIAQAATTVEGLNVTPYFRQSLTPGSGSVRLLTRTRSDNSFGWIDTYQVLIALSQDVRTAETWLDAHVSDVCAALAPELNVQTVTPLVITTDSNPVNGVAIEGTRGESA